jgi:hypothetical protein
MASYFSYNSVKKVTKRTPPRPVCPSGPRGIRLCLRAVLTRRPGSTGLNPTSMSAKIIFSWPYQSRMPRQASRGEGLLPSIIVARMKRSVIRVVSRWKHPRITHCSIRATGSIDQGRSIESCRARMASQDDPLERSPDVTKWNPGMLMGTE